MNNTSLLPVTNRLEDIAKRVMTRSTTRKNTETAENFLIAPTSRRFAIGRNADTLAVHKLYPLGGIIDDYLDESEWHGLPVLKLAQIPDGSFVLNAVTSISPVAVRRRLQSLSKAKIVDLHELVYATNEKVAWPNFVQEQRVEIQSNVEAWQKIYEDLADDHSRSTMQDLMCYRLTGNPDYMENYTVRLKKQYFESFMNYSREIFVDAGGYDGDTSEAFAEHYPDYKKIIFFEPSSTNMKAARKRLAHLQNIDFRPIGLSDQAGTLGFSAELGSASSVQSAANEFIHVDTLDNSVREAVTFIKMDLEGWEMPALKGATRHIIEDRPKLALAVYHSAPDLREIYHFIKELNPEYKVYLRHYTQGWSETVMFFR